MALRGRDDEAKKPNISGIRRVTGRSFRPGIQRRNPNVDKKSGFVFRHPDSSNCESEIDEEESLVKLALDLLELINVTKG